MDKEQLSSIKRYVNSKTSNIQKTVDNIEKKLGNLNSVIVKSREDLTGKIKNIDIIKVSQNTLFGEINLIQNRKNFAA